MLKMWRIFWQHWGRQIQDLEAKNIDIINYANV